MKNCDKFIELINSYIDGDLTADEKSQLDAHLDECSDCSTRLSMLELIVSETSLLEVEPPPEVAMGVMYKIRASNKSHGFLGALGHFRFTAAAAVLAIVIFAASGNFNSLFNNTAQTKPKVATSAQKLEATADSSTQNSATPPAAPSVGDSGSASDSDSSAEQPNQDGTTSGGKATEDPANSPKAKVPSPPDTSSSSDSTQSSTFSTEFKASIVPSQRALKAPDATSLEVPTLPYSQAFRFIIVTRGVQIPEILKDLKVDTKDGNTFVIIPEDKHDDVIAALNADNVKYNDLFFNDDQAQGGLFIILA